MAADGEHPLAPPIRGSYSLSKETPDSGEGFQKGYAFVSSEVVTV
jgi:hypothetical protein